MTLKIAINGFGRIGRLALRAVAENSLSENAAAQGNAAQGGQKVQVVAINDLGPVAANAHLFQYDSIHGPYRGSVQVDSDKKTMDVGLGPIQVLAEPNPAALPWKDLGVDIVLECSGRFTERDLAAAHLKAGARRVIVSAPTDHADLTVVYGVNHQNLTRDHQVISNASCTTNCLAPVVDVLHKEIGVIRGFMTTIHGYTGDQRLVDTLHSDLRRARAAALSMIPTSTGAARAVGLVLPDLKGKIDGTAIRVPVPNVSLVDLTFTAARKTSAEEINQKILQAAQGRLKGVLEVVSAPLVSIDFNHHPASSIFDTTQTQVIEGEFCRVLSWYDNEWGFANRLIDVSKALAAFL